MTGKRITATYIAAFTGATTANGGKVLAGSSNIRHEQCKAVRVGDIATYSDGTTAVIIAGVGAGMMDRNVPLALIGSPLSNGDTLVSSPVTSLKFHEFEGDPIPGLLDPNFQGKGA